MDDNDPPGKPKAPWQRHPDAKPSKPEAPAEQTKAEADRQSVRTLADDLRKSLRRDQIRRIRETPDNC